MRDGTFSHGKLPHGKLPKLTDIPAFNAYMGTGWATPDRTPRVVPGAAEAAADHRARLAAALPDRTVVLSAGQALSAATTRRTTSARTATSTG